MSEETAGGPPPAFPLKVISAGFVLGCYEVEIAPVRGDPYHIELYFRPADPRSRRDHFVFVVPTHQLLPLIAHAARVLPPKTVRLEQANFARR